jgi:hypothetical protein
MRDRRQASLPGDLSATLRRVEAIRLAHPDYFTP